mmetsp:Transcript_3585/g.11058  ORF Transcript_3585/g.11058 Transcript_3585/m.11058 type:complete len:81 (-) Transcript_3585:189-431(-)|eukprot:scaffold133009_cov33-Tisochrysis_lutea.AAC.2
MYCVVRQGVAARNRLREPSQRNLPGVASARSTNGMPGPEAACVPTHCHHIFLLWSDAGAVALPTDTPPLLHLSCYACAAL